MDVLTAEITAKGAKTMNTPNVETEATGQTVGPVKEPRANKKATSSARKPRVASGKDESGQNARKGERRAKKPKTRKAANKESGPREGSKTEKVLDLLKRSNGATLRQIMTTTGWQAHSIRGFLSGTVGKKLGLKLESTKAEDGERTYSIKG